MAYTLVIGNKDWSSWSLRPWLALKMIGVPFAEQMVPLRSDTTSPEIRKHSPSGRVPLLRIDEGGQSWSVWDSLAICETLAERHPEAKLWPDDARARGHARALSAEMHAGFPDVREQLSMDFARTHPTPALRDSTKAQVARILSAWEDALAAHGGDFLFGRFSIADCMYAPVCSRFRTYGIEMPRASSAYVARVLALPAMGEWMAAAQKEVADGVS